MKQVINMPISQDQKMMFNSVFAMVKELSIETTRVNKVRTNNFEEYQIELSGNKRALKILGWSVVVVNHSFLKSDCPHVGMMLADAVRVLNPQIKLKRSLEKSVS